MDDREAMKLALEALEFFDNNVNNPAEKFITSKAIAALRQILEQSERKWIGLTNEERDNLWSITPPEYEDQFAFVLAVEAKLKEKNT